MSYCTNTDVNNLFGDISDDISDAMMATAIENSTAWIDSNLKRAYVPLPEVTVEEVEVIEPTETETITDDVVEDETETETESETGSESTTQQNSEHHTTIQYNLINVPSGLKTASIYYAASDILLSLYHGDELPVQYDIWFQKAQSLLEDYIEAYLHSEADESDLVAHQMVKHSKGLTYNQKRRERMRRAWAR